MKKKDFIRACAEKLEDVTITDMTLYYDVFCETIAETIGSGDSLKLSGVGTLSNTVKAARHYTSPWTDKSVYIPEHRSPKFTPAQSLKDALK